MCIYTFSEYNTWILLGILIYKKHMSSTHLVRYVENCQLQLRPSIPCDDLMALLGPLVRCDAPLYWSTCIPGKSSSRLGYFGWRCTLVEIARRGQCWIQSSPFASHESEDGVEEFTGGLLRYPRCAYFRSGQAILSWVMYWRTSWRTPWRTCK